MTLRPREFAVLGDIALLYCEDEQGRHVTLAGDDPEYVRMLADADSEVLAELEIPTEKFPLKREGWPDEWEPGYGSLDELRKEMRAELDQRR